MVQTGQYYHDYLGSPDMDMAAIAKGFGVDGEVVQNPAQLREALGRARKHTVEGKPYLHRRAGRPQGHRLGGEAVDPADPDRGPAHQQGVRSGDSDVSFRMAGDFPAMRFPGHRLLVASRLRLSRYRAHAEAAPTPEQIDQGREVYEEICQTCHGRDMVSPGLVVLRPAQVPEGRCPRASAARCSTARARPCRPSAAASATRT